LSYKNQDIDSIFSYINLLSVLKVASIFPYRCSKYLFELSKDTLSIFGYVELFFILKYYFLRIVSTCLYRDILNAFMANICVKEMYTGNKEDRYSLVERELVSKYKINLICIPHGLEYGFATPRGVAADVIYTNTSKACDTLKRLYPFKTILYDECIVRMMFRGRVTTLKSNRKIVFFTEARGIDVNITIINCLMRLGCDFYVKLHPKDAKENYSEFNLDFIDDFDLAISNSVCLARKSTVLLECKFNYSIPIACVMDELDSFYVSNVFPSLSDDIVQFRCESDFLNLLCFN
jgi:hypothetical protein